ncbi:aspartate--tRNA ligase, putative [Plasmodium ovale curtisi]|uniref:Aspartate--tRNA ligase, putative n=1 Tax=Plasmodium ovale curtisi TaxID=864141 RepID=A0A1A8VXS5_PLAOA|nr:aspartate--tRNA ligase, putative [Plasmodium ovale curtisi]
MNLPRDFLFIWYISVVLLKSVMLCYSWGFQPYFIGKEETPNWRLRGYMNKSGRFAAKRNGIGRGRITQLRYLIGKVTPYTSFTSSQFFLSNFNIRNGQEREGKKYECEDINVVKKEGWVTKGARYSALCFSTGHHCSDQNRGTNDYCEGACSDFLGLAEVGDLSFCYGTARGRNYYNYGKIMRYIEENGEDFVEKGSGGGSNSGSSSGSSSSSSSSSSSGSSSSSSSSSDEGRKRTRVGRREVLVRGRVERKDRQSKRIFLYLRQDGGVYLTCVYEKKKLSEEDKREDEMYKYIKNLKNESVVDVTGRVKIHGDIHRCSIPHLESVHNQRCIEIVILSIHCISESFYDPPIIVNESYHLGELEEAAPLTGVVTRSRGNELGDGLHNKNDDMNSRPHSKLNTNESLLKAENFCLDNRNYVNNLLVNLKGNLAQKLRTILHKDGYTEVFTPKLLKTDKHARGTEDAVEMVEAECEEQKDQRKATPSEEEHQQLDGTEGGSGCYRIEGKKLTLAQSPQFYKQMIVNSDFEKIFEINYSYRNEKFHTSRHLNEFLSLDLEQIIYDNYYEIVMYMYDVLKIVNSYLKEFFSNELQIINASYHGRNIPYLESSTFSDNPIILSFCEAHELIRKYYRVKKSSSIPLKSCYTYDSSLNRYVKILNKKEKKKIKKRIIFKNKRNKKLHNIYYYNKIVKNYKIMLYEEEIQNMNLPYDDNRKDKNHSNVYAFHNRMNKDELYRRLLLFFNNIYRESSPIKENQMIENKENLDIVNTNEVDFCENIHSLFSLLNLYHGKGKKTHVKETSWIHKLKETYLFKNDFTNDELNYLYTFVKHNFNTDIFIIDQYPIHLRPYYTSSNIYDLRFTNSFDFIYKGLEIISGSQRINNLPILLFKVLKENKKKINFYDHLKGSNFSILHFLNNFLRSLNKSSTIHKYFTSFKYASKPHGGLALGLERFLMATLNLRNVRSAAFLA